MEQCDHCPLKTNCPELKTACKAVRTGHSRYCELTNPSGDSYREEYVHILCDQSQPIVQARPNPKRSLPYETKLSHLVVQCPHRSIKTVTVKDGKFVPVHRFRDGSPAEGCGCSTMRCQLGKGKNGEVTSDQCKMCVIEAGLIGPPPNDPGLLQKAANFAASQAKFLASGMQYATDEEKQRRINICLGCEYYGDKSCRQCGCPIEDKAAQQSSECPEKKWETPTQ